MKKLFLLFLLLIISIIGFGQVKLYNFGYFVRIDYYTKIPEKIIDMPKRYMKVVRQGDYVYLGILDNYAEKILYSDVDIPLFVSSIAMEDTVLKWINESYDTISDNDSLYFKYCCNCDMITGWRLNGDTVFYDSCYVNKYILDSISNLKWNSLSGKIYQRDPTDTLWLKQYGTKYPDGTYQNTAFINTPDTTTWLAPVTSFTTPPVSPDSADRYIASVTGGGWTVNYIYEWNTATWTQTIPVAGNGVVVLDSSAIFIYTGAAWIKQSATSNYWSLTGTAPNMKLFNNSGNYVGINKVNPAYALDVTGRINASTHLSTGAYIITSSSGFYKSALAKGSIGATTASGGANIWNFKSGTTGAGNTGGKFNFIVDNDTVGRLHRYNISLGNLSGNQTMTGLYNNFIGVAAGYSNTTGHDNNFMGSSSGNLNTTGYYNNFIGDQSGWVNTIGYRNNFIGFHSGRLNISGNDNNFIGTSAGSNNTIGINNIMIGKNAGYSSDTLNNRIFIGNILNPINIGNDTTTTAIYGNDNINTLSLNRKVKINNAYTLPTADGTANQVMTTNGSGSLSWASNIKNVSDTMYNKILAIRPNRPDTSFTQFDSLNSSKFPEGTYFEVYPGDYTVTDTIEVNKLNLYAHKGAVMTKSTDGDMFYFRNTSVYNKEFTIDGYGDFIITAANGGILNLTDNTNVITGTFNFRKLSSLNSITINLGNWGSHVEDFALKFKGDSCISLGDTCIKTDSKTSPSNNINLEINTIYSTASIAIANMEANINVKSNYVYSTISPAVYCSYANAIFNIDNCQGSTYGYLLDATTLANTIFIKGKTNGINNNYNWATYNVYYEGTCTGTITNTGQMTANINNGGTVNNSGKLVLTTNYYLNLTNSDGNADINITNCQNVNTNITGGVVKITGIVKPTYFNQNKTFLVNGGTLISDVDFYFPNNEVGTFWNIFTLQSGTLIINKGIKVLATTKLTNFVKKTGGTLILNGATFVKNNSYQQFINAPTTAQDIKIYSGGLTTNGSVGDLISAKARKDSVLITAVAATSITLNDGVGGNETFSCVTCASKIGIAGELVALINASGTLFITATDNLDGTFNLLSDVAGTDYTIPAKTNCTNTQLRENSCAITDVVGGGLIEDSDVTY